MPAVCGIPIYPELAAELARTGMSHAELAAKVGTATGTIGHVVRGRLRPSKDLRRRIAAALGRPEGELFVLHDDVQRLIDLAVEQGLGDTVRDPKTVAVVAAAVRRGGAA